MDIFPEYTTPHAIGILGVIIAMIGGAIAGAIRNVARELKRANDIKAAELDDAMK
jgi:hypothetical protein